MSSKNSNFFQNLPNIPWWVVILGFFIAGPLGVILLLIKIAQNSKPNRQQWNQPGHQTHYTVRQDTNYNVQGRGASSTAAPRSTARPAQTGSRSQAPHTGSSHAGRYFSYPKLKSGKGWTIFGGILAVMFGIVVADICIDYSFAYPQYIFEDAFIPMIFACGGLGMFIWGRYQASQTKKFKRYLARIGQEPLIALRPLAESIPADMDEVYDTLQQMIDAGIFGDRAYLDVASETLVLDASVAKPTPKAKTAATPPQETLSPEDKILRQIRDANDRIPGEEISRKIDRIEEITRHILLYLKKHPERSSELHTFLDYYLPTTLKMLNTYAELDAQQLDGDNIAVTKERIEQILDKVVEGFEAQLDKLFVGDMLDISSDIDVMEKMLQRDGLAGEMKMPKASSATNQSKGYTPKLTLTPDQPESGSTAAASGPSAASMSGQAEAERKYDDLGVW